MKLFRNTQKYGDYEGKVHGSRHSRRTLCGRRMGLFFREVTDVEITCGKCVGRATGPRGGESPKRIQLSRKRGWRKPEGAVVVSRPSRFGNPFRWRDCTPDARPTSAARGAAVDLYREWIMRPEQAELRAAARKELRGRDLCCWCPVLDEHGDRAPCHADVLLEISAA